MSLQAVLRNFAMVSMPKWCQVLTVLGVSSTRHNAAGVVTAFSTVSTNKITRPSSGVFMPATRRGTRLRVSQEDTSTDTYFSSLEVARERLQPYFSFPLDDWQIQAGGAILDGFNVIVCAPTGAGKTVVGEIALHLAYESGLNAIYTTPLKALSNQKFMELRPVFGKENVGLSTGDMSINRGARVTVMTTEVYRNMAWRTSSGQGADPTATAITTDGNSTDTNIDAENILNTDELASNKMVVLDEFHYMGQQGRGGVWEESVITSPAHTQIIGLSATLPNAARLAAWMEGVTGRKTILVEAGGSRPVPLRYIFASTDGLFPLFRDADAGPGSPKGLLGLRGDGEPQLMQRDNKRGLKRGVDIDPNEMQDIIAALEGEDNNNKSSSKFPRGLQVNGALRKAAEKRTKLIDRAIDRKQVSMKDEEKSGKRTSRGRKLSGTMSKREERRERERLLKREMRKAVPALPMVLKRLERRNLLPAIFFIFSRAGCDQAKETVCQFMRGQLEITSNDGGKQRKRKTRKRGQRSGNEWDNDSNTMQDSDGRSFRSNSNYISDDMLASALEGSIPLEPIGDVEAGSPLSPENCEMYANAGLLMIDQVKDVAARVANFNKVNEEIAFDDQEIEHFLFGVGAHHAGMLAAHKAFVETLFREQLMKAVFATETLAAGINMPARTTVICSLAKRGGGSTMNLLATSNLVQMAGRAGRRGMDTDGTCVITATPFEGPDEAVSILTSEIEPIVSQFSPSYSLSVNLIARGQGKLDIAKQLVEKSFAMWEKREAEESIDLVRETSGDGVSDVLQRVAHEKLLETLMAALEGSMDPMRAKALSVMLNDSNLLKKTSKAYIRAARLLDIERKTLTYLEDDLETTDLLANEEENDLLGDLLGENEDNLREKIDAQRRQILNTQREIDRHPFTKTIKIANQMVEQGTPEGKLLGTALENARTFDEGPIEGPLTAEELSIFSKSSVIMKRKTRKLTKENPGIDSSALMQQMSKAEFVQEEGTWKDMLSMTKTLIAYGCLSTDTPINDDDDMEAEIYTVTPAGLNVGMLGFDNSLWCIVAMGGAWDIQGASSEIDSFQAALAAFDDEEPPAEDLDANKPQEEAETLIALLRGLSPSELAGYVSCLTSEGPRGGASTSIVDAFQSLSPMQQRVVQSSLSSLERLVEVQKVMSVDEASRRCNLELSNCDVVTAWAAGCTWSEAIEMTGGKAPGDLARTLARALDALRQLGNLPYAPIRKLDTNGNVLKTVSPGIRPDIRRLCRDAARAMDRYPVKDPLPFETDESDVLDPFAEDEELGGEAQDTKDSLEDEDGVIGMSSETLPN